ncbi:MAG: Crp/Fnr family transcriptional regulator [Gammaproteobacteria bacterium]|nr:Crp/Fnr family transcriptional regulator [Gammaproteobacteria bacterium]
MQCKNCPIRPTSLFADISDELLERARCMPIERQLNANQRFYSSDQPLRSLYTLRSGMIKLQSKLADGSTRIIRLYKPGDTLGLHANVMDEQYSEVVSVNSAELCEIPGHVVERLKLESTAFSHILEQRIRAEIDTADKWITHFSSGTVEKRVAHLILYLAHLQSSMKDSSVTLLVRDDMANIVGVRQESVSRAIAQFKREGLLTLINKERYTIQPDKLKQLTLQS